MSNRDLEDLLREFAARTPVPGAALGVLRGGEMNTAYYGLEDTSTGRPVTAETRFAVGSLCKSMVATALARLAADGRLTLDDPAASWVPEIRGAGWAESATIRDLLANRSGVPLSEELEFASWSHAGDDVLSLVAERAADATPMPAAVWSYSNTGWCLLGRAMETITGLVWEDAMRASLIDPLGFVHTTFATGTDGESCAKGHEVTPDGLVPVAAWTPRNLGPAGSTVLSTVEDLLRLADYHLNEPAMAGLREAHAEIHIHSWLDAWCLGWARFDWPAGPVWGWDGLLRGQRAVLRLMPEEHAAVVLLTNSDRGRALYRSMFPELVRAYFEIEMPPLRLTPTPGAAGDLSRYTGVFAWPDQRWNVEVEDEALSLNGPSGTVRALPIDETAFLVDADAPDNPTITFGSFDGRGHPSVLYQMLWGLPRVTPST